MCKYKVLLAYLPMPDLGKLYKVNKIQFSSQNSCLFHYRLKKKKKKKKKRRDLSLDKNQDL